MGYNPATPALSILLDKQEIHEVLMRYCRGIDRCDGDLLRSVYHPDALDNHGAFVGLGLDFAAWALEKLKREQSTTHFIGNEMIDVQGDVAYVEAYFHAVHRRQEKDGKVVDIQFAGRYVDRFERRNGKWLIADRKVVIDRSRVDPVERTFTLGDPIVGQRSRADPVYQR